MSSAEPGPSIAVEVNSASTDRIECTVVIRNETGEELKIWDEGSSWGDAALLFEVRQGDQVGELRRKEQLYTRNFPRTASIPAGGTHQRSVVLTGEEWEPAEVFGRATEDGVQLRPVYRSGDSAEVAEEGVWAGSISGEFVPTHP